jgi:hypothetical protein
MPQSKCGASPALWEAFLLRVDSKWNTEARRDTLQHLVAGLQLPSSDDMWISTRLQVNRESAALEDAPESAKSSTVLSREMT